MHNLDTLPETIRHTPAFLEWRIQACEARLAAVEQGPSETIKTPIGPLPVKLVVLVVLVWGAMYPEKFMMLLGGLTGIK